jgi:PKHD-type hydroxylase
MYVIDRLLAPDLVSGVLAGLADDDFQDGNRTVANAGTRLKNNLELRAGASRERLGRQVLLAVQASPVVQTVALPARYSFPMFSKYVPGMYYDFHTDAAILNLGLPSALRTDLSCTIFLSDPDSYDGGELTVRGPTGTSQWKLPAGSAVLYRTSDLHRVETVTKGERIAAVLWIQSHVRDAAQRDVLVRLNTACQSLSRRPEEKTETDLISSSIHDLIRMWAA